MTIFRIHLDGNKKA
ncbi:hypothetical protein KX520_24010 [Escherichia coli]|nr:hypothetical protein [Escherichia coli]